MSRVGFSEQSWENVVIKFVNLWGRPCSGSQLNLCAAGKRLAHNSSTDERRADPRTAEAKPHRFLPTCRIVSGITMKARRQTGSLSLFFSPFLLLSVETSECPCTLTVSLLFFIPPQKNIAVHITVCCFLNGKWNFQGALTNT